MAGRPPTPEPHPCKIVFTDGQHAYGECIPDRFSKDMSLVKIQWMALPLKMRDLSREYEYVIISMPTKDVVFIN